MFLYGFGVSVIFLNGTSCSRWIKSVICRSLIDVVLNGVITISLFVYGVVISVMPGCLVLVISDVLFQVLMSVPTLSHGVVSCDIPVIGLVDIAGRFRSLSDGDMMDIPSGVGANIVPLLRDCCSSLVYG